MERADSRREPPAEPGEFQPLWLGALEVWPPVVLAPMAGVTNYPFRSLCREFGAGLFVSEMITARAYLNGNRRTALLASSHPDEHPRSVQIYASDPIDVAEMARALVDDGVEHLDMNFGCPVPKVTRVGGGSAIPVKPRLLARLVRAAVHGAGDVPVTIKVRKGIDEDLLTYLRAGRGKALKAISFLIKRRNMFTFTIINKAIYYKKPDIAIGFMYGIMGVLA